MKHPKNSFLMAMVVASLACVFFTPHAGAVPITGQIAFAGSVSLDPNNLTTATQVTQWRDVFNNVGFANVSGSSTGSFSGIGAGSQAAFATPWTFGMVNGGPQLSLWSVGGFTFDLTTSIVTTRTAMDLVITGTGFLSGNGYDATPGVWNFHVTNASENPQASFSFASSTSAAVPDKGSAVAFLGISLIGLGITRRKTRLA